MNNIKPNKALGQNFLRDKNIIKKIVDSIEKDPNIGIIEIGAGDGALSEELSKIFNKIFLIEIDKKLIDILNEKFKDFKNIVILQADILKINLRTIINEQFKGYSKIVVISNTPYYISSQILFNLYAVSDLLDSAVLMMQKEVALKLNAKPKTSSYNNLSIISQYYAEYKTVCNVSKNVFFPKPKIDSIVFQLTFKKNRVVEEEKEFELFLQRSFNNRRKTIYNNLRNNLSIPENIINKVSNFLNIKVSMRPEEITLKIFIKLFYFLRLCNMNSVCLKSNSKITLALNVKEEIKDNKHDLEGIYYPYHENLDEILINFDTDTTKILVCNEKFIIHNSNITKLINILKTNKILNKNIHVFIWKNSLPEKGLASGSGNLFFVAKEIANHLKININEWKEILYNISSDSLFFYENKICYTKNFGKTYIPINNDHKFLFKVETPDQSCSTKNIFKVFSCLTTKPENTNISNLVELLNKNQINKFIENTNNNLLSSVIKDKNMENFYKSVTFSNPKDKIILSGSGSSFILLPQQKEVYD